MLINNHYFNVANQEELSYIKQYMTFLNKPEEQGGGLNIVENGCLIPTIFNTIDDVIYKDKSYNNIIAESTKSVDITGFLEHFGLCFDVKNDQLTVDDVVINTGSDGRYIISQQIPFINMLDSGNQLFVKAILGEFDVKKQLFKGFLAYGSKKTND